MPTLLVWHANFFPTHFVAKGSFDCRHTLFARWLATGCIWQKIPPPRPQMGVGKEIAFHILFFMLSWHHVLLELLPSPPRTWTRLAQKRRATRRPMEIFMLRTSDSFTLWNWILSMLKALYNIKPKHLTFSGTYRAIIATRRISNTTFDLPLVLCLSLASQTFYPLNFAKKSFDANRYVVQRWRHFEIESRAKNRSHSSKSWTTPCKIWNTGPIFSYVLCVLFTFLCPILCIKILPNSPLTDLLSTRCFEI